MAGYICKHCKFRYDKPGKPKECPYCGRNTLESEKTAEELLEEINEILGE